MIDTIIKDLISMGYRETFVKNIFAKPIGFHLLTFEIDTLLFSNWFIGVESKHLWNTDTYINEETDGSFLEWIKSVEHLTRTDVGVNSTFHFLTPNDILND